MSSPSNLFSFIRVQALACWVLLVKTLPPAWHSVIFSDNIDVFTIQKTSFLLSLATDNIIAVLHNDDMLVHKMISLIFPCLFLNALSTIHRLVK
jgi:hypothetical protein